MIILKIVRATGNGFGPAGKGLIVEAWVCDRPIQVFSSQGLPSVLPVVGNPAATLIIPFGPNNSGLISTQLGSLLGEMGAEDRRHDGEAFHLLGDAGDREACWATRGLREVIVHRNLRHLNEVKVHNLLHHPWWKGGGRVE